MEGPLSKWTNVVKGWQYRWFVLDEISGLLSYFTSKEKMMRGARRGCVRLKGAVIGIDDEDDSTFTLTVDQKTFHFQARDADEKEKWIEALENTILRHSQPAQKWNQRASVTMSDFDKKLAETDSYLQILIDQVQVLETRINECKDAEARERYNVIKVTAMSMIESIKQSIVVMQISKQNLNSPVVNGPSFESAVTAEATSASAAAPVGGAAGSRKLASQRGGGAAQHLSKSHVALPLVTATPPLVNGAVEAVDGPVAPNMPASTSMPNLQAANRALDSGVGLPDSSQSSDSSKNSTAERGTAAPTAESTGYKVSQNSSSTVPETSYSSSEDEDFFDAVESTATGVGKGESEEQQEPRAPPIIIASKDDYYDELYDNQDEDDLGSLDQHGSVIRHLLSQVRIGMDLTKIVLPTFILEKRSLLEMYSDFLAHPDLFVGIADQKTPQERMVQCVRWYMSAFHAGRRSAVAKKPYNPILGEIFRGYYDLPNVTPSEEKVLDGPVSWASKNQVSFIAEQVSHHPPISAFYGEHYDKKISIDGYIWSKSKFLGLSIGVHMIGQGVISVWDYDEEYIVTFPNGYGRSILTVPWVEIGGSCTISCAKTGYSATVEFHTKPFYGGKKDQITAEIYAPNEKKSFCTVKGEWNGVMFARYTTGMNEMFVDTKNMAIVKKMLKPRDQQEEFESRRLWQDVTYNLTNNNIDQATEAKHKLEQRQREEAKQRKEKGETWKTKHFHEVGEHWVYEKPLMKRLEQLQVPRAAAEQPSLGDPAAVLS